MEYWLGAFGDVRLDKRGAEIPEQIITRKTLRRLGGNRAGELGAGRFFASPRVTVEKIVQDWSRLTGATSAGRHVLAIQSLPSRKRGIRPR